MRRKLRTMATPMEIKRQTADDESAADIFGIVYREAAAQFPFRFIIH